MEAGREWSNDRAVRLAAGLAYYSLFALVPVLALAVGLASVFFGEQLVDREIYETVSDVLGEDVAELLIEGIGSVRSDGTGGVFSLISLGTLLFSATLLFVAWREIVDIIWAVPRERGVRAAIRLRGFALAAVLGAGLLLVLLLLTQSLIGVITRLLTTTLFNPVWAIVGVAVEAAVGAAFLAVLFKYSPGVEVSWRHVWLPAAVTVILLSLSAHGYGWYVDTFGLRSAAGVAGTVLLGLVFVYLIGLVLLYGIELVKMSTVASLATSSSQSR